MDNVEVVGIDLAKSVFQVHCVDSQGHSVLKQAMRKPALLRFFSNLLPCLIGMEACSSSHHWGRVLQEMGHTVKLMPPQYVKPYVKTNKNDQADAEAICEAVTRPNMRFVDVKNHDQQSILLLHRDRDGLMRDRTALINRLRATLAEFGITVPKGPARLKRWFSGQYSEYEDELTELMKRHTMRMLARLNMLEREIAELDAELNRHVTQTEACKRLMDVPGIGRLTASALVATVGNARAFKSGRQLSAWLGLVPRQYSSGGKSVLLGISKRGDSYLRRMLIHGARAVVRHLNPKREYISGWLERLLLRTHHNVVIVALANKLARIAWALLSKNQRYLEPAV